MRGRDLDRIKTVTEFLWDEPKSTREISGVLNLTWVATDQMLKKLQAEGWVVALTADMAGFGRTKTLWAAQKIPASKLDFARKPSPDPDRAQVLADWKSAVHSVSGEILEFLVSPRTVREVADFREVTFAAALRNLESMTKAGSIHMAGKRRQHKGPPAQLYCSSRAAASKSILRWWVTELNLK